MWELIGTLAAVLCTISFLPQAIKALKRNTKSISLLMYVLFVIGVMSWLIYGIMIQNFPILISNAIVLVLSSIILVIKIQNVKRGIDS